MPSFHPGYILEGSRSVYRLVEIIGSGGMGIVWKAVDQATDEPVAVKVPAEHPVALSKAKFEAKLLGILGHRNIVGYRDYVEPDGVPMLVEEFVNGVTLDKLVLEKYQSPLPSGKVEGIVSALLIALDYLHSRNIVHRDIKPKNIMVSEDGDPLTTKIIDLGTAAYFNVSGVGDIVVSGGGYTAPEQYRYSALPQSDIWSAAATAFFLTTGRDPIVLLGTEYHVRPYRPPDPTLLGVSVSQRLRNFILKGMAWNVLDRFSTAREALDYLNGKEYARRYPHIEVLGVVIPIRTPSLIFGRKPTSVSRGSPGTGGGGGQTIIEEEEKVSVEVEGDYTFVRVTDPYRWISQHHFEIRKIQGGWCIRDLGSTNRTAIILRQGVYEIWRGKRVVGPCFMLGDKAIILVAYGDSLRNPPYMTVVFNKGVEG